MTLKLLKQSASLRNAITQPELCYAKLSQPRGSPQKRVTNLWMEFSAQAKRYLFAEPVIWDREVGGSNPLAPTS